MSINKSAKKGWRAGALCICCHLLSTPEYGKDSAAKDMVTDKIMTGALTRMRSLAAAPATFRRAANMLAGALVAVSLLTAVGVFHGAEAQAQDDAGGGKTAETVKSMLPEGAQPLPVPRFVTLGPDEVNLRTGPGIRYPIRLVIRKQGLPVEVIREFDVWRQVRDKDGDEGWVHKSMLSGRRSVVVNGSTQVVLRKPDDGARPVVRLEQGVIASLDKCESAWCRLSVGGYTGWIKRDVIWGVYPTEQFKD